MTDLIDGEYATRGEYHKYLDPDWSYYPIYIRKIAYADRIIKDLPPDKKILDAGCGEGVLVEKYRSWRKDIIGLDINVSNFYVQKGDVLHMPFEQGSFDVVLFLDVIEHLNYQDQLPALQELKRVLKKEGRLIISIPNLAHKASRWKFFCSGELIRTANILKHPGDRPIKEFLHMIVESGFIIEERFPIKLTLPPIQEIILKLIIGSKSYEKFIFSPSRKPDDCFLNIFTLRK